MYLCEAVDGGLARAVCRVVVQSEDGSRAGRTDDLSALAALDHSLGALLRQNERRPHVHLKRSIVAIGQQPNKDSKKTEYESVVSQHDHQGISKPCLDERYR